MEVADKTPGYAEHAMARALFAATFAINFAITRRVDAIAKRTKRQPPENQYLLVQN